ncbi:unnamed protein product [Polarella glacialis]|uniref:Uncharacterized protein n=1 Tax=Polarella glacialis TaxID=89957 RepID=A0A813KIW3_POLGL|nr:unnamed protein product [Polarella glacialis]
MGSCDFCTRATNPGANHTSVSSHWCDSTRSCWSGMRQDCILQLSVDLCALCAVYIREKLGEYKELARIEGSSLGCDEIVAARGTAEDLEGGGSHATLNDSVADKALEAVKTIAKDRTIEMSEGIACILGEEMQELERRQSDQRKSIDNSRETLQNLREMIYKLHGTCTEIGKLTERMAALDQSVQVMPVMAALPMSG